MTAPRKGTIGLILTIIAPGEQRSIVTLDGDSDRYLIGGPGAPPNSVDVMIPDDEITPMHCFLVRSEAQGHWLACRGPNEEFVLVDGQPLSAEPVTLRDGAAIRLGNTSIHVAHITEAASSNAITAPLEADPKADTVPIARDPDDASPPARKLAGGWPDRKGRWALGRR